MNKKEFLKNKIQEFEQRVWQDEAQKLLFQFLREKTEKKLQELQEKPIIYDNTNPTRTIRERETQKNKLKEDIEKLEMSIRNLKESIETGKEFVEILKKKGLE